MANKIEYDLEYAGGSVPIITIENGLKVLIRMGVCFTYWTSKDKKIEDYYDVKTVEVDKKNLQGDIPLVPKVTPKATYITDIGLQDFVMKDTLVVDTKEYKTKDYDLVIGMTAFNIMKPTLGVLNTEKKLTIEWE